jgi:DNA-binding LacI/PurR family transcriptional regulator
MSTVTTRDVGKASGFSSSTVSIVLSNSRLARYIPQNTQEKIKTTASSAIVQTF